VRTLLTVLGIRGVIFCGIVLALVIWWSLPHFEEDQGTNDTDPYIMMGGQRILADSPRMRELFVAQMNMSNDHSIYAVSEVPYPTFVMHEDMSDVDPDSWWDRTTICAGVESALSKTRIKLRRYGFKQAVVGDAHRQVFCKAFE
jgi:hypothetical protein